MAESQTATEDADALTFETPDGTETVTVPETFTRDDYAAWFGGVPDEWDVEVVSEYDGLLHASGFDDDFGWVEAVYQTEESRPVFNASEQGWIVEVPNADFSDAAADDVAPGKVLWTRDTDN